MRLKPYEIKAIKDTVRRFDDGAIIYLFGSRVNDKEKGGDIDLLIFSEILTHGDKDRIKIGLFEKIGEQKIDIIIAKDCRDPFVRLAKAEGVIL